MDGKLEDKIRKSTRELQRVAARMDAALSRSEQEENNRLLALRTEERKAVRKDMAVADVIKDGTPEEKAILRLKDYDLQRMGSKGFLTLAEQKALHFSYPSPEEKAVFLNYLKLYSDLGDYGDKLLYAFKMYQVEVALLSKLIDKYEAIDRDLMFYEILYGSLVGSKGNSGMKYNLHDNDKTKMKSLDDTTPEALLAEFNDIHKNDGVVFKDFFRIKADQAEREKVKEYLVADIDFEGGLYDQIKEQGKKCEVTLSYVIAYIEPIEEYIKTNHYEDFAPSRLTNAIKNVKEELFSRSLIAPEYHLSRLNDKRKNGEEITKKEEKEAVVPDYREIAPDKRVKETCITFLKQKRNEQPPI